MTETSREHFQSVIEKFSTAMLITRTPHEQIRARPMSIVEVREDADVWFVTCNDDGKSRGSPSGSECVCRNDRRKSPHFAQWQSRAGRRS